MTVEQSLHKRIKRFRTSLQRLDAHPSAANVHQFRVACRELLVCYPLLKKLTPGRHWKHFLTDALHSLNDLRDLQQMHKSLIKAHALPADIVNEALAKPVNKSTAHWEKFRPQLQAPALTFALAATEQALLCPERSAGQLQEAWQRQCTKSLHSLLDGIRAADVAEPDKLHRLRMRCKKLRYTLELATARDAAGYAEIQELKRLQEKLGKISDYHGMAQRVRRLKLPAGLHKQLSEEATGQARQFLRQRKHLTKVLLSLAATHTNF